MELTDTSVNVTCIHPGGVKTSIAIKAKTGTTISKNTKEKLISDFDKLSYTTSKSAAQLISGRVCTLQLLSLVNKVSSILFVSVQNSRPC